jgi:hypothetical protein
MKGSKVWLANHIPPRPHRQTPDSIMYLINNRPITLLTEATPMAVRAANKHDNFIFGFVLFHFYGSINRLA